MAAVKWLQQFLQRESNATRAALGLAIAGHVIIALLLMLGAFKRIEPESIAAIPVEIVMEKPDAQAPQNTASSPELPSSKEQDRAQDIQPIPAVADVDKHAKAPVATLDVNGIDLPKQLGRDGGDPSPDPGTALPSADGDLASGAASLPSWATAPIGLAQRQTTAREPGEDEMTAIKEQKIECGAKARGRYPTIGVRAQARVIGIATAAQAADMARLSQAEVDRRINPNYKRNQSVFVDTQDGKTGPVVLPSGLIVNVGDVIEVDLGHIDPSDRCQYIPNLAVRKL
jgi:hypothetical protein